MSLTLLFGGQGHQFPITLNFEISRSYHYGSVDLPYSINLVALPIPGIIPGEVVVDPGIIPTPSDIIKPKAYVMWRDYDPDVGVYQWQYLSTAYAFNISNSKSNVIGSFSVTIDKAELYNSRVWVSGHLDDYGILGPHRYKRLQIYYSSNNGISYELLFEGFANRKPETYSFGGNNYITLSGTSIATEMNTVYFESYEDATGSKYSGNADGILNYYLAKIFGGRDIISGSYYVNTNSLYDWTEQDFAYKTALAAVNDIVKIVGTQLWHYMDYSGGVTNYFVGNRPSDFLTSLSYNDSQIISFETDDVLGITTRCEVIGVDENASTYQEAVGDYTNKHGINNLTISSGLIKNLTEAARLASNIISDAQEMEKNFKITTILNSDIGIRKFVTINSTEATLAATGCPIYEYQHSYQYGSMPTTTFSAYIGKES